MQNAIEQMEKDLAEQKLSKDEVGFVGTAYMEQAGRCLLLCGEHRRGHQEPGAFHLLLSGANAKFDSVKFKLLTKTPAEEDPPAKKPLTGQRWRRKSPPAKTSRT